MSHVARFVSTGIRMLVAVALLSAFVWDLAGGVAAGVTLVQEGRSKCVIIIPNDAIAAEQTAARELQMVLKQMSGAELLVVSEKDAPKATPQVHVGPTSVARKLVPAETWQALGQDGIVLKSTGDILILAGGRSRGTLYAVYTFLEDTLGVRWWTSSESTVPGRTTVHLPNLDTTYTPALRYRESYTRDPIRNPQFAAHMKLNGHMSAIPESLGGHYTILGWCHTAYSLLPPSKYFSAHPEWYSMLTGKRNPEGGQLCWSNPGMRSELARQALKWIDANTTAGMISISQNDWLGPCTCDVCHRIDEEQGSPAGSLVAGVNAVAEEIGKKYPGFLVETLAYQYSRKPPKSLAPAKNVIIRLCSIEANNAQPLSSDANAGFRDDLLGWKTIAPHLFVWNYVTSFADYLMPHPNMLPLGADLRFFADNHVIGVFEQGDAFNKAGDFLALRTWLLAHLMWDPARDQQKLREEFLRGYYGAAGAYLGEYLDLVNAPARSTKFSVGCYNSNTSFLSDDTLRRASTLFDNAAHAVGQDNILLQRIRRERLALEHVLLLRYNFAAALRSAGERTEKVGTDYEAAAHSFINAARDMGVVNLGEGQKFESYAPSLLARGMRYMPPKLPAFGAPLEEGQFDVQEDAFQLHGKGKWARNVDDAAASNGKAAVMSSDHTNWAVQFPIGKDSKVAGKGPWRCYVVARCSPTTGSGSAFWYGLHDADGNRFISRDSAPLELAGDGKYHSYGIFVDKLKPGMYFWVSPPGGGKADQQVFVDRIYIERSGTGAKR